MALPMSYEEMKAKAVELFGENTEVCYSGGQWIMYTGVEERFDADQYKDRDAYSLYENGELERWAYKNGHSGESFAELFDSYDEENERSARKMVAEVRERVEQGFDFDSTGLGDWRDRVLRYAEEKGW